MRLHVGDNQPCGFAAIEIARIFLNARQSRGELGLHESLAGLVWMSIALEDAPALRKLLHALHGPLTGQAAREILADWKPFGRQFVRGLDEVGPGKLSMAFVRQCQPGDGSRHAGRFVPDERSIFDDVAAGVEVHVACGRQRRALAIIDRFFSAVGFSEKDETAAAKVSGFRPGDGESERDSDSGVHCISTALHHVCTNARGDAVN